MSTEFRRVDAGGDRAERPTDDMAVAQDLWGDRDRCAARHGWSVAPPAAALPTEQPAEFHAAVPAPSLGLSEEAFTDGGVRVAARTDPPFEVYACLEEPTEPPEGWPYDFAEKVMISAELSVTSS
ncbi:hypothetical protein [Cellulomonas wangsupingiae]|uniref:Uncharacterized protein n=1 Tax=Cellulomonas wangsupingiae TaxID=2968085 RepID=A0ABY5K7J6_9CELL|nr:hypothetical protein [Cellulomonas wangsupingiae]MCC2333773.1 hypothetical protein [Cellulomonas wangsupingiae]UUI65035.1 hypothetical protein NP075_18300 [Cellulomonas wangsupingiae]